MGEQQKLDTLEVGRQLKLIERSTYTVKTGKIVALWGRTKDYKGDTVQGVTLELPGMPPWLRFHKTVVTSADPGAYEVSPCQPS